MNKRWIWMVRYLVVIVLALFLYEWRIALITCVAIPLSLMAGL